jgi:curli biogenesis system outer membrane secretion channel CsgG
MKRLIALLACCGCLLAPRAQENSLPAIFVKPLEADAAQITGWQPALGEGLAEMIITELTKLNKFQVLESTALSGLKDEIKMGEEGYVDASEKVDKGGWKAADYMFVGKVTRFGSSKKGVDLGGFVPGSLGSLGVKSSKNEVQIDWRIVDAATRAVLKTGAATGVQTGVGFDLGVAVNGHGGNIGFKNQEFMNSALGKATVKALTNIMTQVASTSVPAVSGRQKMKEKAAKAQNDAAAQVQAAAKAQQDAVINAPGKVLAVPSKSMVIISIGTNQGLKAGDKLALFETVDTKDDKGVVVFTEEKEAGEITLDSVQADRSKATYSGAAEVKAGWIVKKK